MAVQKLTKTQQSIIDAMTAGARLRRHWGGKNFILRVGDDVQALNRQSVEKLINLGLIKELPRVPSVTDWYSYQLISAIDATSSNAS